ncbi:MAG: HAMP domain-containing histidine kinase [Hyphomonadaceae bacterium JAD_PAG50586_4]|nr:MAG: HAMP domain-containing histidine kinase [Hyphomonadaceae bacterium JAD_PAG50586_4]
MRNEIQRSAMQGALLYRNDDRFSPLIFGSFRASWRRADGRWVSITRVGPSPGPQWQISFVIWIGLALVMILPFAWFFSRRLATPIRALGAAADRIGRGSFERVEIDGPWEIRAAAAALNDMQARLERHVNERTAVIGAIAHDLRTPLARLVLLVAECSTDVRRRVEAEVDVMERMIGVTLDFVRSETVSATREFVDLRLLVEGVVDNFADLGRTASMAPGPAVTIVGDPMLLTRLFNNLVSNALTYGGVAEVTLRIDGDQAIVEIADDGPGLEEADLKRVFEPFYRAERSRNKATGGIGLGLSIVRSLVRAHGGSVELENRTGAALLLV